MNLTDLNSASGISTTDLIHIVITGDTSQSLSGSSYKIEIGEYKTLFTSPDTFVTGGTYSSGTTVFTNNTGGTFSVSGYLTGSTGGDSLWSASTGTNAIVTKNSDNTALGTLAIAMGSDTHANGDFSHAEGSSTTTNGDSSHAEGYNTQALGNFSHAEGADSIASGETSHAEGIGTEAHGSGSHAEGLITLAIGDSSHAEGEYTTANGPASHVEGVFGDASGYAAHSEGNNTSAIGQASHAEGLGSQAIGSFSHAEGEMTTALGDDSHAEGYHTQAIGQYGAHAEGDNTIASGASAHAEGVETKAYGDYSHAEGDGTISSGIGSHAEGVATQADSYAAHAEGYGTLANGNNSHAEGSFTIASGQSSHSEGSGTTASGAFSHAGGRESIANGDASFVHGTGSTVDGHHSIVLGRNIIGGNDDTTYVDNLNIKSVGVGLPENNLGVDIDGNVVVGYPSGLIALDEGGGVGYRLFGRDPDYFGTIGEDAIDFSYSDTIGDNGATGLDSFAMGINVKASGYLTTAFGFEVDSSGNGSFTNGYNIVETGFNNSVFGVGHRLTGNTTTIVGLAANEINSGIGSFNTPLTKPLFVVGNGFVTDDDPTFPVESRSDAFITRLNGSVEAPSLTNALISADTTGRILITKDYLATFSGTSGGSGTTPDATSSVKGILKLTGDLGGTADVPTVPGLTAKAPLVSPALSGTPTAPTAASGTSTTQIATTAFVINNLRPYKVYVAMLEQNGTSAPTAIVLENTLGGTVVWTRNVAGLYTGTLANAFPDLKTFCLTGFGGNGGTSYSGDHTFQFNRNGISIVEIRHTRNDFESDDFKVSVEIRVYN